MGDSFILLSGEYNGYVIQKFLSIYITKELLFQKKSY